MHSRSFPTVAWLFTRQPPGSLAATERKSAFIGASIFAIALLDSILLNRSQQAWPYFLLSILIPILVARTVLAQRLQHTDSDVTWRIGLDWLLKPALPLLLATVATRALTHSQLILFGSPSSGAEEYRVIFYLLLFSIFLATLAHWLAVQVNRVSLVVLGILLTIIASVSLCMYLWWAAALPHIFVRASHASQWSNWFLSTFLDDLLPYSPVLWLICWALWLRRNFPTQVTRGSRLWSRPADWASMHRLWWREFDRQPWHFAAIVCAAFTIQLLFQVPLEPSMLWVPFSWWPQLWSPGLLARYGWPVPVLSLFVAWAVAAAFARDRSESRSELLLTPMGPRGVALAKTFAPSALSMVALLICGAAGRYCLYRDLGSLGADTSPHPSRLFPMALFSVPSHLVFVLCLATVAARTSTASRSRWPLALLALAVSAGAFVALQLVNFGLQWLASSLASYERPWRTTLIHFLMLLPILLVLCAPFLWLALWWRWTREGFTRDYLGD